MPNQWSPLGLRLTFPQPGCVPSAWHLSQTSRLLPEPTPLKAHTMRSLWVPLLCGLDYPSPHSKVVYTSAHWLLPLHSAGLARQPSRYISKHWFPHSNADDPNCSFSTNIKSICTLLCLLLTPMDSHSSLQFFAISAKASHSWPHCPFDYFGQV